MPVNNVNNRNYKIVKSINNRKIGDKIGIENTNTRIEPYGKNLFTLFTVGKKRV